MEIYSGTSLGLLYLDYVLYNFSSKILDNLFSYKYLKKNNLITKNKK
jgi:hypothetical protein